MNAKRFVLVVVAAGLTAVGVLTMAGSTEPPVVQAVAEPPQELADAALPDVLLSPLGAGFTYQGLLKKSGTPCFGTCDLRFTLWDAESAGTQIGGLQTTSRVALTNGLFTVELNGAAEFGASAFDGNARWLQISVRYPAGSGT